MNYKQLVEILNSNVPLCILHYYSWKKREFSFENNIKKIFISIDEIKQRTSKVLWDYKETKNFKRLDNVIITYREEKGYIAVKGYISFDDKAFESKRRFIGLNYKTKNLTCLFDLKNQFDLRVFIPNKFSNKFSTKLHGDYYHYDLMTSSKPWRLKNGAIVIMTYGVEKRQVKFFRFLSHIDNNFTCLYIRNHNYEEEKMLLNDYENIRLYEVKPFVSNINTNLIRVKCTCIPLSVQKLDDIIEYKIIFKDNNLVPHLIPKLIEGTILGNLGRELLINDDNITMFSFGFIYNKKIQNENIKTMIKKIKRLLPDNTNIGEYIESIEKVSLTIS